MGAAAEDRSEAASRADRTPLQAHEQTQVAGVEAGAGVHRLERTGGAERRNGHDGVGDPCRHRADEQERYAHGAHRVGEPQHSVGTEALDDSGQPDPAEELAEAAPPTDAAGGGGNQVKVVQPQVIYQTLEVFGGISGLFPCWS